MGSVPQPAPAVDVEYLKMIQTVIDRLAQNSFSTKNWSVGLITAMLAFSTVTQKATTAVLAFFPAICFCALDVFYLRQERLFRALYRAASTGQAPRFSMDTAPYKNSKTGVLSVLTSPALWLVHGAIMLVILLVAVAAVTILTSTKGQG